MTEGGNMVSSKTTCTEGGEKMVNLKGEREHKVRYSYDYKIKLVDYEVAYIMGKYVIREVLFWNNK